MKIGFVTSDPSKLAYYFPTQAEPLLVPTELPFTPDDQLAVDALRQAGHTVLPVIWGKPIQTLNDYDLVIIRSPWDYMESNESIKHFFNWITELASAGINIANPCQLMQWLLDKHYLADLSRQGIATIPTTYLKYSTNIDLSAMFREKGQYILKPCISNAGVGLYHIASLADAEQYQNEMDHALSTQSYMLQDFIPEIKTQGEWSLIYIGGKYSHAIHKLPAQNEIMCHAERGGTLCFGVEPPDRVIDFANRVFSKIPDAFTASTNVKIYPEDILYLRLDIIETPSTPVLVECEGVEPELFFRAKPSSVNDFVRAVCL